MASDSSIGFAQRIASLSSTGDKSVLGELDSVSLGIAAPLIVAGTVVNANEAMAQGYSPGEAIGGSVARSLTIATGSLAASSLGPEAGIGTGLWLDANLPSSGQFGQFIGNNFGQEAILQAQDPYAQMGN